MWSFLDVLRFRRGRKAAMVAMVMGSGTAGSKKRWWNFGGGGPSRSYPKPIELTPADAAQLGVAPGMADPIWIESMRRERRLEGRRFKAAH